MKITESLKVGRKVGRLQGLVKFFKAKPIGTIGGGLLIVMVLVAIFAPVLVPYEPNSTDVYVALAAPSLKHLLGTDHLGRDLLSRIIYGARISMYVGLMATLIGSLVGSLLGILSGYRGGAFDTILQRGMDVIMSFPSLIIAMGIMAMLGLSLINVILALSLPFIPRANRIIRSATLAAKEFQYVEAARATGCKPLRILFRHIMPNCFAPYMIVASVLLGQAITVEASLSFLGLGVPPPAPSWGRALSDAMPYLSTAPWLAIFPGIAISAAVFAINLLGDALRDILDPRLKTL